MNKRAAKTNTHVLQTPGLRPLNEVISEIQELFDRDGWLGVQGFSITRRTAISSCNLKWGDLKIRRRLKASSVPSGNEEQPAALGNPNSELGLRGGAR